MVTGKIYQNSDVDIGIKNLPPDKFFRVYTFLNKELSNKIALVDFDKYFYVLLNSLGKVVEIEFLLRKTLIRAGKMSCTAG
jgi:hypothetical protein